MAANSKIAWTDNTFNPVWGCQKVGPGCDNCYAEALDRRTGGDHWGPGKPRRRTSEHNWNEPRRWNRKAQKEGRRYKVFCASMADVFDNEWLPEWRADLWTLIRETPNLDWLLLTKRIGNAPKMLPDDWGSGWPHVWLGATVVNQEEADRDIPKLLAIPAAIHFLSIEPMLGPINLDPYLYRLLECKAPAGKCCGLPDRRRGPGCVAALEPESTVDLVIVGEESGNGRRPFDEDWVRDLRDQCQAAKKAFFYKQKIVNGQKIETPELDGRRHVAFPSTTF